MKIRIDHILLIFVFYSILLIGIFIIDDLFTEQYREKNNRYRAEFMEISRAYSTNDYETVIQLTSSILEVCEPGYNDIKAKVFLGLAHIKMNNHFAAIHICQLLIEQYPGIHQVYGIEFTQDISISKLELVFNSIHHSYLPAMKDISGNGLSLAKICSSMNYIQWSSLLFITSMLLIVYERIKKRFLAD